MRDRTPFVALTTAGEDANTCNRTGLIRAKLDIPAVLLAEDRGGVRETYRPTGRSLPWAAIPAIVLPFVALASVRQDADAGDCSGFVRANLYLTAVLLAEDLRGVRHVGGLGRVSSAVAGGQNEG